MGFGGWVGLWFGLGRFGVGGFVGLGGLFGLVFLVGVFVWWWVWCGFVLGWLL